MKNNFRLIIALIAWVITFNGTSQNRNSYIVLINGDSIHCKKIIHKVTEDSIMTSITYTDMTGSTFEYNKKTKIPDINCFSNGWQTFEMIPRRLSKPDKHKVLAIRILKGKFTYCYFNNQKMERVRYSSKGSESVMTGDRLRYVKYENGNYINLTKKTMKNYIKPILQSCEAFINEYKGDYKLDFQGSNITSMLELYNRVCE